MKHNHNTTSLLASTAWYTLGALLATVVLVSLTTLSFAADDSSDNHNSGGECDANEYPQQQGDLLLYNFETTTSTQDEARRILEESHKAHADIVRRAEAEPTSSSSSTTSATTTIIPNHINTLVVTADEQTNGRGTNGRTWLGARGNSFVTICIRQRAWMETQLPLTLLPVKVGTIMAEHIDKLLKSCMPTMDQQQQQQQQENNNRLLPGMTTIKWPNDVLVDEHKISGVLIESTRDWFLIGIGVNVAHAPTVPSSGPNHGRPTTSIRTYCPNHNENEEVPDDYVRLARTLGQDMAMDLSQWLSSSLSSSSTSPTSTTTMDKEGKTRMLLQQWRQWVDWDMPLVMRDGNNRETVMPIDIELDGRLRIKGENGQERLVVTDYFF